MLTEQGSGEQWVFDVSAQFLGTPLDEFDDSKLNRPNFVENPSHRNSLRCCRKGVATTEGSDIRQQGTTLRRLVDSHGVLIVVALTLIPLGSLADVEHGTWTVVYIIPYILFRYFYLSGDYRRFAKQYKTATPQRRKEILCAQGGNARWYLRRAESKVRWGWYYLIAISL